MSEENTPVPDQRASELGDLSKAILTLMRRLSDVVDVCTLPWVGYGYSPEYVAVDLDLIQHLKQHLAASDDPLAKDALVSMVKAEDHISAASQDFVPGTFDHDRFEEYRCYVEHHYSAALSEEGQRLRDIAAEMETQVRLDAVQDDTQQNGSVTSKNQDADEQGERRADVNDEVELTPLLLEDVHSGYGGDEPWTLGIDSPLLEKGLDRYVEKDVWELIRAVVIVLEFPSRATAESNTRPSRENVRRREELYRYAEQAIRLGILKALPKAEEWLRSRIEREVYEFDPSYELVQWVTTAGSGTTHFVGRREFLSWAEDNRYAVPKELKKYLRVVSAKESESPPLRMGPNESAAYDEKAGTARTENSMSVTVREVIEARDALLNYGTRLNASLDDMEFLWRICDANERSSEAAFEWRDAKGLVPSLGETQRLISSDEFEQAAKSIVQSLGEVYARVRYFAEHRGLRTVFEEANASTGVDMPTITTTRRTEDGIAWETKVEREDVTTTYFHTVLGLLMRSYRHIFNTLSPIKHHSLTTGEDRFRLVHVQCELLGRFMRVDIQDFENKVRLECARAAAYLREHPMTPRRAAEDVPGIQNEGFSQANVTGDDERKGVTGSGSGDGLAASASGVDSTAEWWIADDGVCISTKTKARGSAEAAVPLEWMGKPNKQALYLKLLCQEWPQSVALGSVVQAVFPDEVELLRSGGTEQKTEALEKINAIGNRLRNLGYELRKTLNKKGVDGDIIPILAASTLSKKTPQEMRTISVRLRVRELRNRSDSKEAATTRHETEYDDGRTENPRRSKNEEYERLYKRIDAPDQSAPTD